MIDERKLIEVIKNVQDHMREANANPVPVDAREIFTLFIEMVEKQPKVDECEIDCKNCWKFELLKPKWIPCSERLPEENKMSEYYDSVIVTLDSGRVVNGCYVNRYEEWWVDAEDGEKYSINATGRVIAWQPLPEPWKGEIKDD